MQVFGDTRDPYGSYYFALEIDNIEVAHFQEFSGIKTSAEVFEIQEGGRNGSTIKRPGQSKFENLVLKYATSASLELLAWRDEWLQDNYVTRNGSISVRDNRGVVVRRYTFTGAWPVSWEGPTLNSSSSDLAVETLEIAIESLQVDDPDLLEQVIQQAVDFVTDAAVEKTQEVLGLGPDTPDHDRNSDGQADGMQEQKDAPAGESAPDPDQNDDGLADGMPGTQTSSGGAGTSDGGGGGGGGGAEASSDDGSDGGTVDDDDQPKRDDPPEDSEI